MPTAPRKPGFDDVKEMAWARDAWVPGRRGYFRRPWDDAGMTAKPRKPLLVNLTWAGVTLLGLAILYVLSYAPVVSWSRTAPTLPRGGLPWVYTVYRDGRELPLYRPCDWLIDHTPLQQPLFWWAGLFGVREDFEMTAFFREHMRLTP